ncbi:MAG: hypothetical protein GF310_14050 [candidate division Zixibacteria bacterium]|nr:hypothetical protein [candidate division Zixibacteria bacterium]
MMKGRFISANLIMIICMIFGCGADVGKDYGTDIIPPAKITDLDIIKADNGTVVIRWTAPGDDSTKGKVSQYDLRYSKNKDILKSWEYAEIWPAAIQPAPSGELQLCSIKGMYPYEKYYIAIRAIDDAGNASEISNIPGHLPFADFVVNIPDTYFREYISSLLDPYKGDIHYSQLQWISHISILRADMVSLSGLEYIGNLEFIEIVDCGIRDLSPLTRLAKLETVVMPYNNISSILPLIELPNLNNLDLKDNEIDDLRPISDKI